ncbi:MAG TPA: N-acetylmuramoyl-L-alanine amidase [Rubrobacter sp.]|nr:N-acetylmuramoyl-L-alanine amidase [Rubrobacter sp.]
MCSEDRFMAMDRREFLRLGGAGLAGAVLLGGAYGGRALAETGSLRAEFESAAQTYRVPVELLLAMGYVNTLWEMPPPSASDYEPGDLTGRGAYGILQLMQNPSTDTLGEAASLTGLSEDTLKADRAANVRGGAAVLADMQGEARPSDLNGWQGAVGEYGGGPLYAVQVYEVLKSGASATISTGEHLDLAPQEGVEVPQVYSTSATRDYRKAVWRPAYSGNYTNANREHSQGIGMIVVHVAQGSYSGTINWFQDRRANVSAHYVLRRDGKVAQCVRNEDIAWHAGNWKYNKHSIGIEHEGYADHRRTWSDAMYRASAQLAAHLSKRYNVPLDRRHVLKHKWVPGTDHYCPGKYFDYDRYLHLVRRFRRR